jgi:hypothetical protein
VVADNPTYAPASRDFVGQNLRQRLLKVAVAKKQNVARYRGFSTGIVQSGPPTVRVTDDENGSVGHVNNPSNTAAFILRQGGAG